MISNQYFMLKNSPSLLASTCPSRKRALAFAEELNAGLPGNL